MKLKLTTKAKTLLSLSKQITKAEVLPLVIFNVIDYGLKKDVILTQITKVFKSNLIIRSSSKNEDKSEKSNAGKYESVLDVDVNSKKVIDNAIKHVINSFGEFQNKNDEIFVQPMLKNVSMSGVIFTSDIDTLSPYYIINYDESGSTDSVTSGNSNELKTFVSFKHKIDTVDKKFIRIIEAAKECEQIFDNQHIDIEFACTENKTYIFQVRPIVKSGKENLSHLSLERSLYKLNKKIKKLNSSHPNLLGDRTIFGVMPDWNPAEIIGLRPKRLAISLYKELITDETWAYQRDNYGYKNLRSHPLLVSFLGIPFIDTRVSFNSFIPKNLNNKTAKKLVNHYLSELHTNKNHHDKVEFEIIFSCFYFGIEQNLEKLKKRGFSKNELDDIKNSLLSLTNKIIDNRNGLYKKDLDKIEVLKRKFDEIDNSKLTLIEKIYWLIKDARRYGTLPFAGVARAGFIAVQILKSFVSQKILSTKEYDDFLNSLNTVSKQLSNDRTTLPKETFLKLYGHLRPGTYDILSPRYDEAFYLYFDTKDIINHPNQDFKFSNVQKEKIKSLIKKNNLETSTNGLINFIIEAIEGREYAKFIFTKNLSQVLKYIEEFGSKYNFNKEDLAHLDIKVIMDLYATLDHRDVKDILNQDISKNKEFYKYTKALKLPNLITDENDIYSFQLEYNEPNFVTLNKTRGELMYESGVAKKEMRDKIICIKSADPGFDYLFSKGIKGLITCYGGANSHMAIRCAEIGIPAVIGCGEQRFNKYIKSKFIEIDCLNKTVKILK